MQYIHRHWLAIIAYLIYFAMWLHDIIKDVHLRDLVNAGQQLTRGEWAGDLTITIGVVFAMIIAANAIGRSRDQTGFYLILLVLILIPLIVLCKI